MGRIAKDDRCLIMGLRTEKKWGANRLISEFMCNTFLVITVKKMVKIGSLQRLRDMDATDVF